MQWPSRHPERPDPTPTIAAFLRDLAAQDDRTAAHAWRTAVTAMLAARHLDRPVDLQRVLEMALVQGIPGSPEALREALDPDNGLHLSALRLELETGGTSEARLVDWAAGLSAGGSSGARDRFLRALAADLARQRDVRAAG